jgi:hypothetical protein
MFKLDVVQIVEVSAAAAAPQSTAQTVVHNWVVVGAVVMAPAVLMDAFAAAVPQAAPPHMETSKMAPHLDIMTHIPNGGG